MRPPLPSPFTILAVTVAGLFGLLAAVRGLVDADYYWHVVAGRLVSERGVLESDPFSFTYGGQPWTMHEWLGELLIYILVDTLGVGLSTFLFGTISVGGALLIAWSLRRSGVPMVPLALALALTAYLFASYATIRPQALSWLMLGCLLAALIELRPGRRWLAWVIPAGFVLWANLHGLYVAGLAVLALYAAFTVAGRTAMSPSRWETLGILVAAVVATMLTPAGPEGLLYPLRYVDAGDWGLRHIAEWQSPDFHDPRQAGLLLLIVALLVTASRATPGWLTVASAAGVGGALLATRNVPLAALMAMPALAHGIADRLPGSRAPAAAHDRYGRRALEMGLAVVVLVAAAVILPRLQGVAGDAAVRRSFPVDAVRQLAELRPDANVLAEYQWGGYVIHELYGSGARVFVDGRNDMYGDRILEDYVTLRNAQPGWEELLSSYSVEAILLPPGTALVDRAPTSRWCEAHRDEVAVLFVECR